MKKYLISYGDDNYVGQKEFFKQTAIASSYFSSIQMFGPNDLDAEFINAAGSALQYKRGAGYWIWKPYIIYKVLAQLAKNDILIYCDAGCMINVTAERRYSEYIEMLASSYSGTIDFELPFKEYEYTKREVFDYFESSPTEIQSNQLLATVLLFRKCEHTTSLVEAWYRTAVTRPDLFTDEKFVKQDDRFIDHRHDQSIFSLIRKRHGANIIKDETWFKDFVREGRDYPFWATRLKG